MTDTDNARKLIETAQELDAVATKGPWEQEGPVSSKIVWSGPDERVCFLTSDGNPTQNARFIAASRQLVPALAAALQAALEREERLREALDRSKRLRDQYREALDAERQHSNPARAAPTGEAP